MCGLGLLFFSIQTKLNMHIFLRNSLLPFLALIICLPLVFPLSTKRAAILNFGDGSSDTGNSVGWMGQEESYPYGRLLSTGLTSRATDGRLVIDLLCEHLGLDYLNPYLNPLGQNNFSNGVNFAVLGACALKPSSTSELTPFHLKNQVLQLKYLHKHYDQLNSETPKDDFFKNALYVIDIGQNDLSYSFSSLSLEQVIKNIPSVISEIGDAIRAMHQLGGRKFWVQGTGPLGCLPLELAIRSNSSSRGNLDQHGCLKSLNEGAKAFNAKLRALCKQLLSQMPDSKIVFVDMFTIKYNLIANSTSYGFKNPLMASCGRGGTSYNFDPANNKTCWTSGFSASNKGTRYLNWDGVRYTEAANAFIVSKILSNKYSSPPLKLDVLCNNF